MHFRMGRDVAQILEYRHVSFVLSIRFPLATVCVSTVSLSVFSDMPFGRM